jgi:5-methylcytosine-specific restriction protein A
MIKSTPTQRLYYSARWRHKAKRQLRHYPLCAMCEEQGRVTAAQVADHIVPHNGNSVLFYEGKLQSLCYLCHNSTKQQIEKKGYSNAIGVDGWPIDTRHPFYRTGARQARVVRGDEKKSVIN